MPKILINPDAIVAIEIYRDGIEVVTTTMRRYTGTGIEVVEMFGRKWFAIEEPPPKSKENLPLI